MRCPDCHFEGSLIQGRCARCGHHYALPALRVAETRVTSTLSSQNRTHSTGYPLQTGDVLCEGRYRILKLIPLPGFHRREIAWMATERASHRHVVLRGVVLSQVVGTEGIHEKQVCQSIIQRLAALGNHASLPRLLHHFTERGIFFVVFHPIGGESLEALLNQQQGILPEPIAIACGWHLCAMFSLFASQQPPYIHGSLTPDAILVSENREQIALAHLPLLPPSEGMPVNQEVAVSPYAAPEQVRGSTSPSSDLYTIATILYHSVTGSHPAQRTRFFYPLARRLNPAVTPEMEMILAQQLRLAPSDRYASPTDMQRDLALLVQGFPHQEQQKTESSQASLTQLDMDQMRAWSKSSTLLDIGVMASMVVLVLVGLFLALLRP